MSHHITWLTGSCCTCSETGDLGPNVFLPIGAIEQETGTAWRGYRFTGSDVPSPQVLTHPLFFEKFLEIKGWFEGG